MVGKDKTKKSELKYSEHKISAGSYDLNRFLYGGYEKDIITTIYGPAGSGKTNFCILAAVSQAKKDNKIIFIDTEGGFSVERLKQILGKSNKNKEYKKDFEKVLKNIILFKPVNFDEQKNTITSLLREIKNKGKINLIIVDGMTMLYRLELADAKNNIDKVREINRELAKQLRIFAEIARHKNIPIIATNQVYSEFLSEKDLRAGKEKKVHMVGGDLLKYWSKCIIELQYNRGKRKAVLQKHRSLPEKELSFMITKSGIRKKGWI